MSTPTPTPPSSLRSGLPLVALALLLAAVLAGSGPIAQWPDYHHFADQRTALGIPHAADVLSNLAFAIVGLWGIWRTRAPSVRPADPAWRWFSITLVATAIGSASYHWAPDNAALVFDRLPIACACAALLCAFLAERFDAR